MMEIVVFLSFILISVGAAIGALLCIKHFLKSFYTNLSPMNKKRFILIRIIYDTDVWRIFGIIGLTVLLIYWLSR